jgi:hypothetical protein
MLGKGISLQAVLSYNKLSDMACLSRKVLKPAVPPSTEERWLSKDKNISL